MIQIYQEIEKEKGKKVYKKPKHATISIRSPSIHIYYIHTHIFPWGPSLLLSYFFIVADREVSFKKE